jgi:hypothetical protein
MQKDKIIELINLAKINFQKNTEIFKAEREAQLSKEFLGLNDKVAPYLDKLIRDIEVGALAGNIHYQIIGLPQSDFDVSGSFDSGYKAKVRPNTVTSRIIEVIKEWKVMAFFGFSSEGMNFDADKKCQQPYGTKVHLDIIL